MVHILGIRASSYPLSLASDLHNANEIISEFADCGVRIVRFSFFVEVLEQDLTQAAGPPFSKPLAFCDQTAT